ncbi:hypothetical protein FRAHR75_640023 [Frankia sp. Hr75.2]|nr:hypothetical protein FRAHR75_640023 [Frankia sp. Hr75.2]
MQNRPRDGARTRAEIRAAAVALFFQHGYESTSQRMLADRAGIKAGSLYNHIGSKDELLADIMTSIMDRLISSSREALENAGPDPVRQLGALIDNHLRFHAKNAKETLIGNSELRSLSPDQRQLILGRRREYEFLLRGAIETAAQFARLPLLDSRLQTGPGLPAGPGRLGARGLSRRRGPGEQPDRSRSWPAQSPTPADARPETAPLRFALSYRDAEELLAERGIEVDHVTVYRWVQQSCELHFLYGKAERSATWSVHLDACPDHDRPGIQTVRPRPCNRACRGGCAVDDQDAVAVVHVGGPGGGTSPGKGYRRRR